MTTRTMIFEMHQLDNTNVTGRRHQTRYGSGHPIAGPGGFVVGGVYGMEGHGQHRRGFATGSITCACLGACAIG